MRTLVYLTLAIFLSGFLAAVVTAAPCKIAWEENATDRPLCYVVYLGGTPILTTTLNLVTVELPESDLSWITVTATSALGLSDHSAPLVVQPTWIEWGDDLTGWTRGPITYLAYKPRRFFRVGYVLPALIFTP